METARAGRRRRPRWLLFALLLGLTVLASLRVGEGVNPQYEASATAVVLVGPQHSPVPDPYGAAHHTTRALAIVLDDPSTRARVQLAGFSSDYVVTAPERRTFLEIGALSASRETSLGTVHEVLRIAEQELAQRQESAGVPADARYQLRVIQPPSVPAAAPWRVRNMLVVAILGAALSWVLARHLSLPVRSRRSGGRRQEELRPEPQVRKPTAVS